MTIPAQMSLHGFIATTPQLTFTHSGIARLHFRAGVEHWRKEPDGAFTKLDPTFHDLVLFRTAAERAYAQLRVGDQFLASGYITEYEVERNGVMTNREEFVAQHIGHDAVRTRYEVDRTPKQQPIGTQVPEHRQPAVRAPESTAAQSATPGIGL
jgi:single-strand DNA-binding protein